MASDYPDELALRRQRLRSPDLYAAMAEAANHVLQACRLLGMIKREHSDSDEMLIEARTLVETYAADYDAAIVRLEEAGLSPRP